MIGVHVVLKAKQPVLDNVKFYMSTSDNHIIENLGSFGQDLRTRIDAGALQAGEH